MRKLVVIGFAATALSAATAPVVAEEFPPKFETLKQITMGSVGGITRGHDPRGSTVTITSGSTSTSIFPHAAFGSSSSRSETFDNTPGRPGQVLRIINGSIYDLKDLAIECSYFAESGTPVGSKSQKFLLIFPASSRRDVLFRDVPTLPDARGLACAVTEFEYVGIGQPPPPVADQAPTRPLITKPVSHDWGNRP